MSLKLPLLALLLTSCAGQQKNPCTPEARQALIALYDDATGRVISSGQCDKVQKIENCAAYRVVEEHFAIAEKALCQ